jgi:DNA processing protein
VTIVIEAPVRSGALITAYQANDFSRDVYVLPGSIDNPNSLGCLGLLSRGAQPILGLNHLLELLATLPQLTSSEQLQLFPSSPQADPQPVMSQLKALPPPDLDRDLQQVWLLVTDDPISFDEIVVQSQFPTAMVSSILLQLELLELVNQLPGMRYQR